MKKSQAAFQSRENRLKKDETFITTTHEFALVVAYNSGIL